MASPNHDAAPHAGRNRVRNFSRLLLGLSLLVVALDQWSKVWIRDNVRPGEELPLWPGVVHLSHVLNHGAAWGAFEGQRWLLSVVSVAVIIGIVYSFRRIVSHGAVVTVAMGMILGGAVGNLIDRVAQGWVTDMIDFDTPLRVVREFPVFNVADSALTLGVVLLAIYLLFVPETAEAGKTASASDPASGPESEKSGP